MITVLHIVTSLDPGGMENGLCNIARGLAPRGVTTHVACLERSGPFAARLPEPANVHVLGKRAGFSPRAVLALWRVVRRVSPALIHTHNLGPLIYAALATLGGRRPILHGEHSQLAEWELTPARLRQRRRFYKAARHIHTVSNAQRDELVRNGFPAEKITAIPNGVDTARFTPGDRAAARARLGIPADALAIGLVGRFGPFKRHDALIAAFDDIAARFPNAALVFIGTGGSEEQRNTALAKNHAHSARIHLAGFQPEPAACYPALDLLAVPSVNEGMSNAVLEAMACGVPALANAGCGNEALITDGDTGWIADLGTPAALGAALAPLLASPQALVDTGRRARLISESRFSLTAMLDAYEQLYRRLATSGC